MRERAVGTAIVSACLALSLAACGAEAPAAPGRTASSESAPAGTSGGETIGPGTDLASLLPTTVDGGTWTVQSFSGDEARDVMFGAVVTIASDLDIDLDDLHGAAAFSPNHSLVVPRAAYAFRFRGAEPDALLEALPDAAGGDPYREGEVSVSEERIGARDVRVLPTVSGAWTTYFYAIGDVVIAVQTPDSAEAEAVLAQLP